MIVLDTNQLDTINPPSGSLLGLLTKIAANQQHSLAIPAMVLTEHLAHHWHKVSEHAKSISTAARQLSALLGRKVEYEEFTQDEVCDFQRRNIESLFSILKEPDGAAIEALRREAFREAPAKTNWTDNKAGSGARDVLIWLTVLEAAKNTDETIVFVTAARLFQDHEG